MHGTNTQWRRHEVLAGGTDSGPSNPHTPKFRFLIGFRSLYFENLEKFENFGEFKKKYVKFVISGGSSPFHFLTGGTRPPRPPCVGAHARHVPIPAITTLWRLPYDLSMLTTVKRRNEIQRNFQDTSLT